MWDYTDKVKDHFLNPRNVGEIEDADGVAEVGSIACGDALKFTFKLDENGRIKDAKFKTFGCASAIASASAMTEMIKGMTVEEAARVTNQDIANYLGGLPQEKMHCSVLGREALEKAISHYKGTPVRAEEEKIVCECFGVTEKEIERAIRENRLTTVEEVTNYTKAGGGCGNCHPLIQEIIDRVAFRDPRSPAREAKAVQYQEDQNDRRNPGAGNQACPEARRRRHRTGGRGGQSRDGCNARRMRLLPGIQPDDEEFRRGEAARTGLAGTCG